MWIVKDDGYQMCIEDLDVACDNLHSEATIYI